MKKTIKNEDKPEAEKIIIDKRHFNIEGAVLIAYIQGIELGRSLGQGGK